MDPENKLVLIALFILLAATIALNALSTYNSRLIFLWIAVARALNGGAERSPRLSTATTARTPMTSSLRSRPERFYTGRDTSDDEADQEQDFMNTPRSHSRK